MIEFSDIYMAKVDSKVYDETTGWQSMVTAPRDGTVIIGKYRIADPNQCDTSPMEWYIGVCGRAYVWRAKFGEDAYCVINPVAWRPI